MHLLTLLLLVHIQSSSCGWDQKIQRPDVRAGLLTIAAGSVCDEDAHGFAEIHYVMEGHTRYSLDSESIVATEGTAVLVPDGSAHRVEGMGAATARIVVFRWAPGGDESALHGASTMTDPVPVQDVPDVPRPHVSRPRRYEPGDARGEHLSIQAEDVDWTTNFTYDEELWKVYRYKPLVREPLADWPGVPRDDVRMGLQELDPRAAYPGHHHPSPEIYFVLSGSARWQVGGGTFSMGPGDAIFTPPNTRHRIENVGPEPLRWLYLWWAPGGSSSVFE